MSPRPGALVRGARTGARALRTLAALAVIPLGMGAGLVTGLAHRDRRRALNRTFEAWGDWGTRAAGIRLEVLGAENLALRPAVFLINHRSGVDPILVCALLRRDFTAIAKQEIRRNPVLGPAFSFAGVAFVDRADRAQAVRALEPATQALGGGMALAVAPEGTRRERGAGVGPFKKGAFRVAMAARVPIVPIVIHDADDALPRGGWLMRPARVHVEVLPPIPTSGWTLDELDEEIASVRALYEERLKPAG
ncbi:MAG: lysophospholipid acyltransferase family protein [Myxococcota bacterium]|nr:lysophospholipid acyltransferase family protein [Myxococcota bacterium]